MSLAKIQPAYIRISSTDQQIQGKTIVINIHCLNSIPGTLQNEKGAEFRSGKELVT